MSDTADRDRPVKSARGNLWQMPEYPSHYFGRSRKNQWGHPAMILFLTELTLVWNRRGGFMHPFGIGDISFENGGAPPTHFSHTGGACVDIFILHRQRLQRREAQNAITWNDDYNRRKHKSDLPLYDRENTHYLIEIAMRLLKDRYQVVWGQFFYNDPDVLKRWPGRIWKKDNPSHDDHVHIQLNAKNPYQGREAEILSKPLSQRPLSAS